MKISELALPVNNQLNPGGKQATAIKNSFSGMLSEALAKVNNDLLEAEKLTQDFALGKNVELHQVIIATEQANLALQLTIQVRNKVIEAYQEINEKLHPPLEKDWVQEQTAQYDASVHLLTIWQEQVSTLHLR